MLSPKVATSLPWLGLVPKQMSTGDRTILGKISRRGNRYLRVLFVQAAWVVSIKPKIWVAAIALANKTARMVWAIRGSVYMTDLDTGQTSYNLICYRIPVSSYMGSVVMTHIQSLPAEWLPVSIAPSDGDLEVCVMDYNGIVQALVYPFHKDGAEWVDASNKKHVDIQPTHWRKWTESH
jgi:hypothetical protein